MDHLAVHKVKGVEGTLAAVGARASFMPPYSPDPNPIEQVWSKVKSWVRQESPPTFLRLIRSIGRALSRVDRFEAFNYFNNA